MRDLFTLLCHRSAELNKAFGFKNLRYSKISVAMPLWYRIAAILQNLESEKKKEYALRPNAAFLNT